MDNEALQGEINELRQKVDELTDLLRRHQHDGVDGTDQLRKTINLDGDQFFYIGGIAGQAATEAGSPGSATERYLYAFSAGADDGERGWVNELNSLQMNFDHYPNSADSFVYWFRGPIVVPFENTSITVTATQDTVTIAGYDFDTNSLAGALINIYTSGGTFVETQTIASNTGTVITISGTWGATTSGGTFQIYSPVYIGSADYPNERFYANEGTGGGIRFGVGPTAGGQNGLLYMDAAGDIYWRNKSLTTTDGVEDLSAATITVDDTSDFDSSGLILIDGQVITYTGKGATTFTGCSGGVGSSQSNTGVYQIKKLN